MQQHVIPKTALLALGDRSIRRAGHVSPPAVQRRTRRPAPGRIVVSRASGGPALESPPPRVWARCRTSWPRAGSLKRPDTARPTTLDRFGAAADAGLIGGGAVAVITRQGLPLKRWWPPPFSDGPDRGGSAERRSTTPIPGTPVTVRASGVAGPEASTVWFARPGRNSSLSSHSGSIAAGEQEATFGRDGVWTSTRSCSRVGGDEPLDGDPTPPVTVLRRGTLAPEQPSVGYGEGFYGCVGASR